MQNPLIVRRFAPHDRWMEYTEHCRGREAASTTTANMLRAKCNPILHGLYGKPPGLFTSALLVLLAFVCHSFVIKPPLSAKPILLNSIIKYTEAVAAPTCQATSANFILG